MTSTSPKRRPTTPSARSKRPRRPDELRGVHALLQHHHAVVDGVTLGALMRSEAAGFKSRGRDNSAALGNHHV